MSEFEADYQDDEVEIEAIGVEVSTQPIELYKVLKIADVVSGGGEAKYAITEGYVAVNGEIETRKRRKLYDGDLIEFNQEYYLVICDAPVSEPEIVKKSAKAELSDKTKSPNKDKKKSQPKQGVAEESSKSNSSKGGRGAIKFF